ncbi:hypothetical protein COCVIDRAFT_115575 [Bipolaris victoriae FI3]|uniref:HTH psq-type domain-containing protein n=1 Tax=Bipolaris victoriae (strain FI3) TaxID=930091 RepID=W7DXP5_BIPV3|nr:hypothetical protein COCVIDRAFT_115575 [Bipolaris victoriae FI3]
MGAIDNALTAIESLKLGESFMYQESADRYSVQRSTLSRRHQGIHLSREAQATNQQKLSPEQELELARRIKRLTERRLPPA